MFNLPKDINNIVSRYLDYSIQNLIKILSKHKLRQFRFKNPDITIEDIFTICVRKGYKGFYIFISDYSYDIINILKKLIRKSTIKQHIKIYKTNISYDFELSIDGYICHIDYLGIIY